MESTMIWIAVAAGGALGSVARHGVNVLVQGRWPLLRFPLATLAVNVLGCFAIGLLAGLVAADKLHLRFAWREFVFVGILGGFTTFSSFGLDTLTLARSGAPAMAIVNVVLQVGIGLSAAYAGFAAGR
jgi:fluoride exporter